METVSPGDRVQPIKARAIVLIAGFGQRAPDYLLVLEDTIEPLDIDR